MKDRVSVLAFLAHYLPGCKAGGPVRSMERIVAALADEFEFHIVTSDRDLLDDAPYPGIAADAWNRVGKAWVYYASPERRGATVWRRLMRETPHDVLYLNSLFDPRFTLRPLLARRRAATRGTPIVLAPRGELSPGALHLKRWKKVPFLGLTRAAGLYRDVLWHASTGEEAQLIRQTFGARAQIAVARDMSAIAAGSPPSPQADGDSGFLRVVFLSRISRKKNLDYALRVLARTTCRIHFDIWGPLEDAAYWRECQDLIRTMPENVAVRYRGVASASDVNRVLAGYDLFILPTRGENYGHVIAEALAAGTPVLLSDTTPWRDLRGLGVGWDLPLDDGEGAFLKAVQEVAAMPLDERADWRRRVRQFALEHLGDPRVVEANRRLFLRAIAAGDRHS